MSMKSRRNARVRRTPHLESFVEPLENRVLMSAVADATPLLRSGGASASFLAAVQPTVTPSSPAPNGTINRDGFVSLTVNLSDPGNGIDATTLQDNVLINRVSDGQAVLSTVNTDAGGGVIVIKPNALLAANTQYKVRVLTGLKDTAGNSFAAFTMFFNSNDQVQAVDGNIRFSQIQLPSAQGRVFTALTIGPDHKLYAGTLDGQILRFTINADNTLGTPEVFNTINAKNGETRSVIGMEFDPTSTASNLILWVTHNQGVLEDARDFSGKLSRLKGPTLSTYTDFVINLPRSVRDHETDQLHFGPDNALYFVQPAMNAMGAADPEWVRSDHPLSGAMLRVEIRSVQAVVDVLTPDGGGTYNPAAPGALVTVYATGIRNAYDFVFHSNGHLYAPANGSQAGGSIPAGHGGVPAQMDNVQETMHDYVYDVVKGGFYGQPNITRNELILNGGNPTSGVDPNEIASYPVGTQPEANYRGSVFDFGANYAPTGVIEYKGVSNFRGSDPFGGRLVGRMLVTRYSGGDDVFILTPDASGKLTGVSGVGMDGLNDPTDIVEDPVTGALYVSQMGTPKSGAGNRITLLVPQPLPSVSKLNLINADGGYSLGALKNQQTFDLAALPTRNLSVRADTTGSIGSIRFSLDSTLNFGIDNTQPYGLKGNNSDGSYIPWTPTVGKHTLAATIFSGANATGTESKPVKIVFYVRDSSIPPFNETVNFLPSTTPRFHGTASDWGRGYATRGNGLTYGWTDSVETFDRNAATSPDDRYDTGAIMNGQTWNMKVPNGSYAVYVLAGDPIDRTGTYGISVEGTTAISGFPTKRRPWLQRTVFVNVTDGNITIAPISGSINNKLNIVQIASLA
jgi:hypothetical protein